MCDHHDCALHRLSGSACAFISHGLVYKQASLVGTTEPATRRDAAAPSPLRGTITSGVDAPGSIVVDCVNPALRATVLVVVWLADAALALVPAGGTGLFGSPCSGDQLERDLAVQSCNETALALLGGSTPWMSFLAGEWVDDGLSWRVVLCACGGVLRPEMALAVASGSSTCSTNSAARWVRADKLGSALPSVSGTLAKDITLAALARASAFVRPGQRADSRLRLGRGDEAWVDSSMQALSATQRGGATAPEVAVADDHERLQAHLASVAALCRSKGEGGRAAFFEDCAARVAPLPVSEFPEELVGDVLTPADIEDLYLRPFRRDTKICDTVAPPVCSAPLEFPLGVPTPTCHADVLLPEVMSACAGWYAANDTWHCKRLLGLTAQRPRGLAWGVDAALPRWRPFFAAGGVLVFDEHTGSPSVLCDEAYKLKHNINGEFARAEFAAVRDKEIVAYMADGVCIKAQGLPFIQLAPNLESLYEASGPAGVKCVAAEILKFGQFDGTGWYLRGPTPDASKGILGAATLPSVGSPLGAVPKPDGSARLIIDMGFGYDNLRLQKVTVEPLPSVDAPQPASRPHFSSITTGGGGGIAVSVNSAAGPYRPAHKETYQAGGRWPWQYEGKSSVAEQATNAVVLSVVAMLGGLRIYHANFDFWKAFHQTNYNLREILATANTVPEGLLDGEVSKCLRNITNSRMAMGAGFASGVQQRESNVYNLGVLARFDGRQQARRLLEPECSAAQLWLQKRSVLPHDDYGRQDRMADGGWYTDDPTYTIVGGVTRVEDLIHSFYDVLGPEGLGVKMADVHKWLVGCYSMWQGVRFSASLGILWLPPDKVLKANDQLMVFQSGRLSGADFVKMMGFLNYLESVLAVHHNINAQLWAGYDAHRAACNVSGDGKGVTSVVPGTLQLQPIRVWRKLLQNTTGTTLLRIARRMPPPDIASEFVMASDACFDIVVVDGVQCGAPAPACWPAMGGSMHCYLWQYLFSDDEIKVLTIPVAEFIAGPVGLMVYTAGGRLEYAKRIVLEIDAYATPRCALRDRAKSPNMLAAHEEFVSDPIFQVYRKVLTSRHVFGSGNDLADKTSRNKRPEAERLCRFLGHEPRWLPVPPNAHDYIRRVIARLRNLRDARPHPRTCDPATPGGDAPRFKDDSPVRVRRYATAVSPPPAGSAPTSLSHLPPPASPAARFVRQRLGSPSRDQAGVHTNHPVVARGNGSKVDIGSPPAPQSCDKCGKVWRCKKVPPEEHDLCKACAIGRNATALQLGSPPALSAGAGASPRHTRLAPRLHSPLVALGSDGKSPVVARLAGARMLGSLALAAASATSLLPAKGRVTRSDGRRVNVIEERVEHLMHVNATSDKPYALRGDTQVLRDLLTAGFLAEADGDNKNTAAHEDSHFNLYWVPYCALQNTPVIRPDVSRLDYNERLIEEAWWGGCIPWMQTRMKNGAGVVGAALPSSLLKVLRNMKHMFWKQGIHTVSLHNATRAADGLLRGFLLEHGPLALIPKRKEPLTNEEIGDMFSFCGKVGSGRGSVTIDWATPAFSSLLAMFHVLAQTGMRKGEVSLPAKEKFDRSRLSFENVRWRIGGDIYNSLTPELYGRLLREGGYALLRPPPSKADQFSLHWGACTIYLKFSATETINAARELAREEMRRAVDPLKRHEAPLFVNEKGLPWRHDALASIFYKIMVAIRGEARAKQVSMHSWRVYLACALLAAGAAPATIQCLLRWRSDDALKIYARINDTTYAGWLSAAGQSMVSSVRTTTSAVDSLSHAPEHGSLAAAMQQAASAAEAGSSEAGFQDAWRQRASAAVDVAVREASEHTPTVDAYRSMSILQAGISDLLLQSERMDQEDAVGVSTV